MTTLLSICASLEQTSIGVYVRESLWGFPILVSAHIIGLAFSVGILIWFDLRLLGLGLRGARVSIVYRRLIGWAGFGFTSMFVTGGILFTGFATKAVGNVYFLTKMSALVLAGINAVVYHLVTERRIAEWDEQQRLPAAARVAGGISLALWVIVIFCGRMMSYTMF